MDFDTSEDENVFDNAPLTNGIYGYESSTAETYATSIGKTFHALYTVTFNSNGGSSVSSMIKTDGSKITKPTDPTKTNYSFEGWYTDNTTFADEWNFANGVVTSDITLYAKWIITHTVSFDSNSGNTIDSIKAEDNTTISAIRSG